MHNLLVLVELTWTCTYTIDTTQRLFFFVRKKKNKYQVSPEFKVSVCY